jgi:hypothetical protein
MTSAPPRPGRCRRTAARDPPARHRDVFGIELEADEPAAVAERDDADRPGAGERIEHDIAAPRGREHARLD